MILIHKDSSDIVNILTYLKRVCTEKSMEIFSDVSYARNLIKQFFDPLQSDTTSNTYQPDSELQELFGLRNLEFLYAGYMESGLVG